MNPEFQSRPTGTPDEPIPSGVTPATLPAASHQGTRSSSLREVQPYGPRPLWRGVWHSWTAIAYWIATPFLLIQIPTSQGRFGVGVFLAGMLALFSTSALYHRIPWEGAALGRMRRLDHGIIFVVIASIFAPFCLLALPQPIGRNLLSVAYLGAALGIARVLLWPYAPKPVAVTTYALLPLLSAPYLSQVFAAVGPFGTGCMVLGNAVAGMGSLVYAYGRPNPIPDVFGAHEVFHAAVVACAICYTTAVMGLALRF